MPEEDRLNLMKMLSSRQSIYNKPAGNQSRHNFKNSMAKKKTVKIKKSEVPEEISDYILSGCLSRDLDPYTDAQLAEQMVEDHFNSSIVRL